MRTLVLAVATVALLSHCVQGGPIGPGDFGPGVIREGYSHSPAAFDNPTPIVIGGDTYTTKSGLLRHASSYGNFAGGTGAGLSTSTAFGYIRIVLGIPSPRAGLNVGKSHPWAATVRFYDESGSLLGTISASGSGGDGVFAGWEADAGLIASVWVTDTLDSEWVLCIDNFTREAPIPEAPVLSEIPNQRAQVGELFTYDVDAVCTLAPVYSLENPPAGMTIDGTTGVIEWTPTIDQTGSQGVRVIATNSAGSDEVIMHISVPLVAPVLAPIPDATVMVGEEWKYCVQLLDGSPSPGPTHSLPVHPDGMTIGVSGIHWTPTIVQVGANPVTVRVANSSGSDTTSFVLNVEAGEEPRTFRLRTLSQGSGSVTTPGEGNFYYAEGTVVSITATPADGSHFVTWRGTAVSAGKVGDRLSPTTTVTMHADYQVEAVFNADTEDLHKLVVDHPSGGNVIRPSEGSHDYAHGAIVTLEARPYAGYRFVRWGGSAVDAGKVADAAAINTTLLMDADYTLTAYFAIEGGPTSTLTISSTVGGSVLVPGEGSFEYNEGTSVSVLAQVEEEYVFTGWSGTAVSAGKVADTGAMSTTVTVDGDYTVVANFTEAAPSSYTLSISSGEGGSVTSPGEGAFAYEPGATVSVQAVANSGYAFSGWTGSAVSAGKVANAGAASTSVTVDADYTLKANFQGADHTLEVSSTAGGWVTTPGEGSFSYSHNQSVTLEAQAQPGYHFVDWSGSLCSSSNPVSLEMNSDHQVTANFAVNPPILTVSSGEGGRVVVPGERAFVCESGTEVRAVAVPEAGYVFAGWTGTLVEAGTVADPSAGRVDFVIEADSTLDASFALAARCLYVDISAPADLGEDGTWEHPFDSVQEAIDAADTGGAVLVLPGTYREHLSFRGKDIMVSAFDLCSVGAVSKTVLAGTDANSVVVFEEGESAGSILAGFTIQGGAGELGGGIRCCGADPIIANCLIAGNRAEQGGGVYCLASWATLVNCTITENFSWLEGGGLYCDSDVTVINSIFYGNRPEQIVADPCQAPCVTYSAVRGGWPGQGNLDCDPRFVEQGHWSLPADPDISVTPDDPQATWVGGNYHLKAEEGHWNGWGWLCDGSTSLCVDAGHPNPDVKCEPLPNGNRINMGAFGGTAEASQSPSGVYP